MTSQPGEPRDPQETVDRIDAALTEAGVAAAPIDLDNRSGPGGPADGGPGAPDGPAPSGPADSGAGGDRRPPAAGPGSGSAGAKVRRTDQAFKSLTQAAGVGLLVLIVAIALFLVLKATHALSVNKGNFLTTQDWSPDDPTEPKFGIAALLFGTLATSILAMLMAVPVAVGIALFITQYAPRRIAGPLAYLVDLLAAVPSVVYGLWGLIVLVPHMKDLQVFLNTHLGWFPLFAGDTVGRSIFVASVVLAIMILPIVAAISREVFVQVPAMHKEAALALGATRWEMIRTAVLPFGKPGVISASILGLGRAMGETIAVALVLPSTFHISWKFLTPAGNTIAANVANTFGEAQDIGRGALIASGLVLFIVTMLVNLGARAIIARRREFSGAAA